MGDVDLFGPASVTSRHLANYNDTCTFRHALRAAYRTAISAAQILVLGYINRLRGHMVSRTSILNFTIKPTYGPTV